MQVCLLLGEAPKASYAGWSGRVCPQREDSGKTSPLLPTSDPPPNRRALKTEKFLRSVGLLTDLSSPTDRIPQPESCGRSESFDHANSSPAGGLEHTPAYGKYDAKDLMAVASGISNLVPFLRDQANKNGQQTPIIENGTTPRIPNATELLNAMREIELLEQRIYQCPSQDFPTPRALDPPLPVYHTIDVSQGKDQLDERGQGGLEPNDRNMQMRIDYLKKYGYIY